MPTETPRGGMLHPRGDSGLKAYGGFVNEEFLRKLQGNAARRIFNEMANNDPTVAAILEVITSLICSVDWTITAADESAEAQAGKQFAEEVLFKDMNSPLADVMAEACTAFVHGFACMEITYKLRQGPSADKRLNSRFEDGRLGIRQIALRGQSALQRWEIVDGEVVGFWHQTTLKPGPAVYIPLDACAHFRTISIKNNPEGQSVLRRCYRPWFFKSKIEDLEGIGIERDLAGLPVARIPSKFMDNPANDPADRAVGQAWQRLVTQVRRDQQEGLIIPSDTWKNADGSPTGQPMFEFSLLSTAGGRQHNTTQIIDRYDRKIATAMLADFIFLGQGATGSFALSSDKTSLFAQALGAYLKRFASVLNGVIEKLWDVNAMPQETRPTISPGDLEKRDLNELAGFLTAMTGAGAMLFPDDELENHMRKQAGLPQKTDQSGSVSKAADYGVPMDDDEAEGWDLDPALEDRLWGR
mgnify:CR=1 FL=1